MIKINVIGGIFGTDGYSSHTRNLANALYKIADCRISTQLIPGWERLVNDAELDMVTKQRDIDDINLIITTPHNWKVCTGLGKNVAYCVWEGNKIPLSYIDECLNPNIDMILVPSKHTKQAILKTIKEYSNITNENLDNINKTIHKIYIVPHGVDKTLFHSQCKKDGEGSLPKNTHPETRNTAGEEKKTENMPVDVDNPADKDALTKSENSVSRIDGHRPFKFFCNKGWRGTDWDRGGVQYVLRAFAEEFKKGEKVELIVKLNPAYINGPTLHQSLQRINLPKDGAPIHMRIEDRPFNKLIELYHNADVYVCATRAEAFNLPGLEAMACGLPTIQTSYGGQTDYMTTDNSLMIDYKLEEVKEDIMYEGTSWATPDIASLKRQMRWAYEHQNIIKKMGKQAEIDSNRWTWDISAQRLVSILEKQ